MPVYVAKNMLLQRTEGSVSVKSPARGGIRLGFAGVGLYSRTAHRGIWDNAGEVHFEGGAYLGVGSRLNNYGSITFGDHFCITAGAEIVCQQEITFGKDVLISWDTLIMDTDFHRIYDAQHRLLNPHRPIHIGDHVWIGCRCTILKGVQIPAESVIAAGSVLTHEFTEEHTVIGGENRVLKTGVYWEK